MAASKQPDSRTRVAEWQSQFLDTGQAADYQGITQVVERITANTKAGQDGSVIIEYNGLTTIHKLPENSQLVLEVRGRYDWDNGVFRVTNDSVRGVSVEFLSLG